MPRVKDIDIEATRVVLKYGRSEGREWFEWWNKARRKKDKEGIVIQRREGDLWHIFFIKGEEVRTLEEGFLSLYSAVRKLRELGFKVMVEG